MQSSHHLNRALGLGLTFSLVTAGGAIAQNVNFDSLEMDAQTKAGTLRGQTGGTASLPAIVSNTDSNGQRCLGFGDPNPDHLLTLKQDLPQLRFKVNSGGADTSLVVQGPDGRILCGSDISRRNQDDQITAQDLKAGQYRIWVGTSAPREQRSYRLYVRQ